MQGRGISVNTHPRSSWALRSETPARDFERVNSGSGAWEREVVEEDFASTRLRKGAKSV